MLTDEELSIRWRAAMAGERRLAATTCAVCSAEFKLGDLVVVFGDLDAAVAKLRFECDVCAWSSIEHGFPSAAILHIPDERRGATLDRLTPRERENARATFEAIDRLIQAVEVLARSQAEAAAAIRGRAKEELPS